MRSSDMRRKTILGTCSLLLAGVAPHHVLEAAKSATANDCYFEELSGEVRQYLRAARGEVNIVLDERYVNTAATRSYKPVSIALNPYTNILYIVHQATGDVVAIDARVDQSVVQDNANNYPPLLCPDGAGGYRPSPRPTPSALRVAICLPSPVRCRRWRGVCRRNCRPRW